MKRAIVYFSWSNNTKHLVEQINEDLHLDIYRIEKKKPYSNDYQECAYVEAKHEWEKRLRPEIVEFNVDWSQYDEILLFFPIWWYTFPMPIATFIASLKDYQGLIRVFANSYTNDPQYMANVMNDLKAIDSKLRFEEGLFNRSIHEHLKLLEGEKR